MHDDDMTVCHHHDYICEYCTPSGKKEQITMNDFTYVVVTFEPKVKNNGSGAVTVRTDKIQLAKFDTWHVPDGWIVKNIMISSAL